MSLCAVANDCAVPIVGIVWYATVMKPSETLPPASSYVGHVKNGVVVLDTVVPLAEGQAVRVEPLASRPESPVDPARTELLAKMKQTFDAWTEEDGKLSDEEADCLHIALQQNRGLSFRTPKLD